MQNIYDYADLPNFWHFISELVRAVSANHEFPSGLTLLLIVMLTIHGLFVLFLTVLFHRAVDKYLKPKSLFLAGVLYFLAINLVFVSHFADLLVWTYATLYVGAIKDPIDAFYFVGEMYTTLGFGEFSVSPQWRILPIIISIGGIFSASISAAAMYSMLNALIGKFKYTPIESGKGF